MIIPPAVATTVQLVSGAVASAKNAFDLAKASSDRDLKGAVSELYDSLLEVKGRVLDLDQENRDLKAQLARKGDIDGPTEPHGYFFYKDKPDKPLCPKCYQSQPSNIVFLEPIKVNDSGGRYRECLICKRTKWEHLGTPQTSHASGWMR
jgi:hypothetical protein